MVKKKRQSRHKLRALWFVSLAFVIAASGGVFMYLKPVPAAAAATITNTESVGTANLSWPVQGQAAVGAVGYGVLASHNATTQIPTASTAKLITVLTVLKKYPLTVGQQGPTLTLSAADVALYHQYVNEDGSNTLVSAGEQITEYQALEALLLPSSNNMADSLAIWAFGSLDAYHAAATAMLQQLGITQTTVGVDASGFSPSSTSTASDLVNLGEDAMENAVVAQIVAQPSAVIPVAGTIRSVNYLLGHDNIIGLKTGSNDQDGGCYIFAATYAPAAGQSTVIVGAIMGSTTLAQALAATPALLKSTETNLTMQKVAQAGQVFGTYALPWSKSSANAVAQNDVSLLTWHGSSTTIAARLEKITGGKAADAQVGNLVLTVGQHTTNVPLVLEESVDAPSLSWRIKQIPSQVVPASLKSRLS